MQATLQQLWPYYSVLIVESENNQLIRLETTLRVQGFTDVITARNYGVASIILQKISCHVAMVELAPECMDILETLAHGSHANTLVIGMCFLQDMKKYGQHLPDGVDALVPKSAGPRLLSQTLQALLTSPAGRRGRLVPLPGRHATTAGSPLMGRLPPGRNPA